MMRHLFVAAAVVFGCSTPDSHASPTPPTPNGPREVAILAGGCFWGMEHVLLDAPGIVDIEVGYAGGTAKSVTYEDVSSGTTGYAESVKVTFDPSVLSYEDLLVHWYFRGHNPTTLNRQNNDVGTQYRSEIFTMSPAQAKAGARGPRAGRAQRQVGVPDRHQDRAGDLVGPRRGLSPGLPGQAPARLQRPLPAVVRLLIPPRRLPAPTAEPRRKQAVLVPL